MAYFAFRVKDIILREDPAGISQILFDNIILISQHKFVYRIEEMKIL